MYSMLCPSCRDVKKAVPQRIRQDIMNKYGGTFPQLVCRSCQPKEYEIYLKYKAEVDNEGNKGSSGLNK